MKDSLKPGVSHRFVYRVPREKTVPFLYPEAPAFQAMPEVFATGYMVGLMEWASVELLKPHLDEGEGSLGTHIDVSHLAATPPGFNVTVDTEVTAVEGRRVILFTTHGRRTRSMPPTDLAVQEKRAQPAAKRVVNVTLEFKPDPSQQQPAGAPTP